MYLDDYYQNLISNKPKYRKSFYYQYSTLKREYLRDGKAHIAKGLGTYDYPINAFINRLKSCAAGTAPKNALKAEYALFPGAYDDPAYIRMIIQTPLGWPQSRFKSHLDKEWAKVAWADQTILQAFVEADEMDWTFLTDEWEGRIG